VFFCQKAENMLLYLITEDDNNQGVAVVKDYEGVFERFSFDPNGKLATFTQEDFDKLDLEKLKQTGKYKFIMQVKEDEISNIDELGEFI
jgi:hypothetical protein